MADVDWRQAPLGTRWWAVDVCGKAHWYRSPEVPDYVPPWDKGPIDAPLFNYQGDWNDSLQERPSDLPPESHLHVRKSSARRLPLDLSAHRPRKRQHATALHVRIGNR